MVNNNLNRIDPSVDALIRPIIENMSRIDVAQRSNPIIGSRNEPEYVKEMKKSCVHITCENGEYKLRVSRRAGGELVCDVCGREINTKFDDSAIETITNCIKVINQVLLFGMLNNLRAEPISTLISLKQTLPSVCKLIADLNVFVKKESETMDSERNIGIEYAQKNGRSFTEYFNL